jgi:ureidoglycolate lyase
MNAVEQVGRPLQCQPLTAEVFSPFGMVIDPSGVTPELINNGTTRRYSDLAALDLGADGARPRIGIYDADARHFPFPVLKLERHLQAAQVFLPLGMHRFVVVVSTGGETPEAAGLVAFVTAPGQGISLHRGTWHHGLIALNDGDRFAVIEGRNYRSDTEEAALDEKVLLAAPQASGAFGK